ncbi:MAG: undecaprenyldiphospho-muramoylpentapeptide beta-N-acetylglucosaminyltransferase [Bacteroidales bacterium]|nr:undecaprenyldiphospho-muramoylpentapeptide beta-N-acetylglucosaminyltransferase [Bacteroidales bacterium]MDD4669874.1 undecaprenyldiphospho-muramoylpentapeptide beta-N-acetylglucosaminyltransferase [Bacteroidales bacterium]
MDKPRIIISGGGTGGHIFPALSIANSIKEICPDAEILFVGAIGKMEMEKVPAAGYPIKGLPVAGLQRKLSLSNLALPFKIIKSISIAGRIIKDFKPDVAVGVGGYASAPLLWSASHRSIPCLIQEQNSFAGLTNKILGKRVSKICVAYDGMEKFFPKEKIIFTGNPIRKEIAPPTQEQKVEGYKFYNLDPGKKTVFIVGGSLGSRTLNNTMIKWVKEKSKNAQYQVIWQSGKYYRQEVESFLKDKELPNLRNYDFIQRMDLAFAVADVIVSRAGAGTISELCATGKATIFVPSPNVAEDHQTHNAMALVEKNAAMIVKDIDAEQTLMDKVEFLISDEVKIKEMETNILKLGKKNAGEIIAREVLSLIRKEYE